MPEWREAMMAREASLTAATLDCLDAGLLAVDEHGMVTHHNEPFRRIWQLSDVELRLASHDHVLAKMAQRLPEPGPFLEKTRRIRDGMETERFELLKLSTGQVIEQFSKRRVVDDRPAGRVWMFRDVSRQRAFEQQLRTEQRIIERQAEQSSAALTRSEQLFQQLIAGVTDYAIFMLDTEGYVISWNPGAERIKGYASEEVLGEHFSKFYTDEDRADGRPEKSLQLAIARGKYDSEGWRVRKDGSKFWASILVDPIRNEAGELIGYAKVTRDMTEYRAMQEQLHQSQKMEAIGQLTGGVAHDFNNLLTVILGNLDTIERNVAYENERLRRAVAQAMRGAQRAATLTQQLLAFARRQPLNPKPCDINELVADMSDLLRRTLGENIAVQTTLAPGLWRVDVDAHQLESAILNLAVNSRDAMPHGGRLAIQTANVDVDETYASRFSDLATGQYVQICVTDTGTGMPPDVLGRAFDPFFTTKPMGQGTGLGLSQVYGFVKQSNGHVKLDSEPNRGTTVRIYLPRLSRAAVDTEIDTPINVPRARPGETILVVEDDDDVRIYSTESLRELGFEVLEAPSAEAALGILDKHPEIDLLFTDVVLPGANGRELLDRARRYRPNLKALLTTGYARDTIVHNGRLDAGIHLLTKPFTRAQLASRVREVLDLPRSRPAKSPLALVVEDEELVRLSLTETLESLGFRIVEASTSAGAVSIAETTADLDVAIIDIGLPDRSGLDLARDLRNKFPRLPLIIASGYGTGQLGSLSNDTSIAYLPKPYDERAVLSVLEKLGLAQS
jgi:PAS domain S-box-containing protein